MKSIRVIQKCFLLSVLLLTGCVRDITTTHYDSCVGRLSSVFDNKQHHGYLSRKNGDLYFVASNANSKAVGVIVGLSRVNPDCYNGNNYKLSGPLFNVGLFTMLCGQSGVSSYILIDERATKINFVNKVLTAKNSLKDGGLIIIYFSGHGQQFSSIDEPDGKNEALCLFDGPFLDDHVWTIFKFMPDNIRVWMISDSCNAGSNYRLIDTNTRGVFTKVNLLHWGSSGDGEISHGSSNGGCFTKALFSKFNKDLSYADMFTLISNSIPTNIQIPTRETTGVNFQGEKIFQ